MKVARVLPAVALVVALFSGASPAVTSTAGGLVSDGRSDRMRIAAATPDCAYWWIPPCDVICCHVV